MIRPAKFADVPAIEAMIRNTHRRSRYVGRTGINEKALNTTVMGLVAGQNQTGPASTFCMIAEVDDKPVAFMAGMLNRIYGIGDKLNATDLFLVSETKNHIYALGLIQKYIAWARKNPKVIEIGLSWTNALPKAETVAKLYERLGAVKMGETYEIKLDVEQPGDWEQAA